MQKRGNWFISLNLTVIATIHYARHKKNTLIRVFGLNLLANHAKSIMPTKKKKSKSIPIGKIVKTKKGNNPYKRKRGL